jgi:CheY-like chemotaxis protein
MRILFVEDDKYFASVYAGCLEAHGFDVTFSDNPTDALSIADADRHFDVVVLDMMMPYEEDIFSSEETLLGRKTGIALLKELRIQLPDTKFIALTNSRDPEVQAWFEIAPGFAYCYKGDFRPEEFANFVHFFTQESIPPMRAFIVHGHDSQACLELKNYLQNTLGLPEPVILAEKPSLGMTIIEKFEYYADDKDLVFALFTPDDFSDDLKVGRARQNVVFEYGYFLGVLGRRSGRVFLLHKGETEIPSDLRGIVYIDITPGIESAGEQIRRELRGLFDENRTIN